MVRHIGFLYELTTVLGLTLLSLFLSPFSSLLLNHFILSLLPLGFREIILLQVSAFALLGILGTVFFIVGLCGVTSKYHKKMHNSSTLQSKVDGSKKYSKFFKIITVLGLIFLSVFLTIAFLITYSVEAYKFFMSIYNLYVQVFFFCLFSGTSLLTVGACGILRQYFKNYKNLLTILIAILIPLLILMPLAYLWASSLEIGI